MRVSFAFGRNKGSARGIHQGEYRIQGLLVGVTDMKKWKREKRDRYPRRGVR